MSKILRTALMMMTAAAYPLGTALAVDEDQRETIVVTASRVPQDIRTVGSSVSVISGQEIARFQERFAIDALTTTPGAEVARYGGPGGNASLFLRGADSYQTLVLIDGIPVEDPSLSQSAFDFGRLPAADIQKIEILRGPQSTLYGGDAIGGIVSITTNRSAAGFHASGLAEGGSFGTRNFAGSLSGGTDNLTGYINYTNYFTEGFPAADEKFGNHMPQSLDTTQVTAGGRFSPVGWLTLDASLRSADSEAGYASTDFLTNRPIDAANEARTRERSGRFAATTSFFDGAFTGTASFTDSVTRRHYFDTAYGESYYAGERRQAEYVASGRVARWLTAVGGLSWRQDMAHTTYDPERSTITRSVFGELQAEPLPNVFLTAGGRNDSHSSFGDFGTYRITGAYLLDATGTKFRAANGTGFRAPTLFELYAPFYGNPDLNPETSRGWEIGFDQQLPWDISIKATYFDQRINNRIAFDPVTFIPFNTGHTTAQGVELEADWDPFPQLGIRAVYTYDYTKDLATGASALRRARHSGSLLVSYDLTDALGLTLKLRLVGPRVDYGGVRLSGYATADVGARYAVTENVMAEFRIQNVTDTGYEEVYGYGTGGRAVYGGVSLKY